jgi:hypothetical protein
MRTTVIYHLRAITSPLGARLVDLHATVTDVARAAFFINNPQELANMLVRVRHQEGSEPVTALAEPTRLSKTTLRL